MKLVGLLSCVGVAYCEIPKRESQAWLDYKQKYGKQYNNPSEEHSRYQNFIESLDKIRAHNERGSSLMKMGLNQFSDWSSQEFETYSSGLGLPYPEDSSELECPEKFEDWLTFNDNPVVNETFKDDLDWRSADKNHLNLVADVGVKDQGSCGSCYAFSAVAAMEGSMCIQGLADCSNWEGLSEQHILDCGTYYDNQTEAWMGFHGCSGGWQSNAFQFAYYTESSSSSSEYPYESGTTKDIGACRANEKTNQGYPDKTICGTVNKFGWVKDSTSELMKKAIYFKGPLAVGLKTGDNLRHYESGIYTKEQAAEDCPNLEETGISHAVTAVGYGVYDDFSAAGHVVIPYWIIKNSWGTTYGDNGYILMEAGANACGIEGNVMYTNMKTPE